MVKSVVLGVRLLGWESWFCSVTWGRLGMACSLGLLFCKMGTGKIFPANFWYEDGMKLRMLSTYPSA